MSRQAISTGGAPAAIGPYSQGDPERRHAVLLGPARARSGRPASSSKGVEAQAERSLRNLQSVLDAAGLELRRRREDDDLPGRHRRLRGGERGLRPVHAGSAAGALDRPGRGACRRAAWSRSRRSPGASRSTPSRASRPDGRGRTRPPSSRRTSPARRSSARRSTGITEAELDARPADGGWTPREVVHHTADSEMTSAIRLRRLVAEDDPLIVGYDGDEFARRLHYDDRPIGPALDAIDGARATTAQILDRPDRGGVGEDRHPLRERPVRRRALAGDLRRPLPRARRPDPPGPREAVHRDCVRRVRHAADV